MLTFTARPAMRGQSAELDLSIARAFASKPPGLRVLRESDQTPTSSAPGFILFDAQRQFADLASPALYARRVRGLRADGRTHGGMWQFDLWEAHPNDSKLLLPITTPTIVHAELWVGGTFHSFRMAGLISANIDTQTNGSTTTTTTTYHTVSTTASAKFVRTNGQPGGTFTWTDESQVAYTTTYDTEENWGAKLVKQDLGSGQYAASFTWARDGVAVLSGVVRHVVNADDGGWQLDISLEDRVPATPGGIDGLEPLQYFYYGLYADTDPAPGGPVYPGAPTAAATSLATSLYGGPDRMYAGLPAVHRNFDEPTEAEHGIGQLRRFLSVFGSAHDLSRGLTDALALRNDPQRLDVSALGVLARSIGWDIDRTTPGHIQRNDVMFATDVFEGVGTIPTLAALLRRALPTGWTFQIHEYINNIFLLNGGPNAQWDVWRGISVDGLAVTSSQWYVNPTPSRLAGRPAGVLDGQSQEWMFWHDNSSGRRELWVRWPTLPGLGDKCVMANAPDNVPGLEYTDEGPAVIGDGNNVRLFWSSNRNGTWSIWTRTAPNHYQGGAIGFTLAEQVSDDLGEDRSPAVVREAGANGRLWVFWSSNRRGQSDIWARTRTYDADKLQWVWDPARRITTSLISDESPTVVLDGSNKIRLYWSAVTTNGTRLFESILSTDQGQDVWGAPTEVAPSLTGFRDESPAAVALPGLPAKVRLYWHSTRKGAWQIWTTARTLGPQDPWDAPAQVTQSFPNNSPASKHMVGAKEPAIVVEGGALHVYWRAQLLGERYTSRTFDKADAGMKDALALVGDWNHYTYDGGRAKENLYSYDTVGVHFTVPAKNVDETEEAYAARYTREITRIKDFIATYRPATVRIVWFKDKTPLM